MDAYLMLQGGESLTDFASDSRPATISAPYNAPMRSRSGATWRIAAGIGKGPWSLEIGTGALSRYSEHRDWQTTCGGHYCHHDDFEDMIQLQEQVSLRVKRNVWSKGQFSAYGLAGGALIGWSRQLDNCIPTCANIQQGEGSTVKPQAGIGLAYGDRLRITAEYVVTGNVMGMTTQQFLLGGQWRF